jgi:hypothetical protein
MKQHDIKHITDLLALDEDEFARLLPDLIVWWRAAKAIQDIDGAVNEGFVWVDDGEIGIDHYQATDPNTGKVTHHDLKDHP